MMRTKVKTINVDDQYLSIAKSILESGVEKNDRTGTGTKSIFSAQVVHDMSEGFPLLTTKKVFWKGVVTELLWFLRGETNIKYLVDNGCNIWNGDAYKNYERRWEVEGKFLSPPVNKFTKEEFVNEIKTNWVVARELGELGPVYGAQWRDWGGEFSSSHWNSKKNKLGVHFGGVDQIQQAIDTLKTNPDSRRIIVNAWNVGELNNMVLPPCHWAFELYTEELTIEERHKLLELTDYSFDMTPNSWESEYDLFNIPKRRLSLKWHQRSVDLPLGLPFNIASYGLLLEILAKEVNMVPGTLIGDLTNVHIYKNQIDGMIIQIERDPYEYEYPELIISNELTFGEGIDEFLKSCRDATDFMVDGSKSYSSIKMPLSN
jgi:thymidylate synthase